FEQLANSCAQFGSGFFGERHDQDLLDRTGGRQQEIQYEMLDGVSLASARVRLDNRMLVMRNLFEDRGSAIGETGQTLTLRFSENFMHDVEAAFQYMFQRFSVGRQESSGVTNGSEIRTAGCKIVVADFIY